MKTVILAEDEASIYLQASDKYVWAPRGQTPIVRVNTNRDCTHIYGSLNLITGKETVMRSQIMNSETTALYLNVLLHTYPDQPILLLWDRGPITKAMLSKRYYKPIRDWKSCGSQLAHLIPTRKSMSGRMFDSMFATPTP